MFAAPQGVVLDARTLVQSALSQQQLQQLQAVRVGKQAQQQEPAAAGGAGDAAEGQLAKKLSSSMRLDISEQVRNARMKVQSSVQASPACSWPLQTMLGCQGNR